MRHQKNKLLIILAIIAIFGISLGCLESKPYANIQYIIIIETDQDVTTYLPIPLDLPNSTVSDLVPLIKIAEKENNKVTASYEIIDTEYGPALKIRTNGGVTLKAISDYKYLQNHPQMPVRSFNLRTNEPLFFDLSMKTNQSDPKNFSRWAYLETPNNKKLNSIKVREILAISVDAGEELWSSLRDDSTISGNFTLKPGWQIINFDHAIGVH